MDKALREAAKRLATASDTPRLDAELLLAYSLGVNREAILLGQVDDKIPADFEQLVGRRLAGEPIAYITGYRDFWTISIAVAPGVLIPRPDSETLIEAAVAHFGKKGPKRILDLGTGPGSLLLAALDEWPDASGIGVDISEDALKQARANAQRLEMADRAEFQNGDWGMGITERFDLILCNPPYIGTDEILPRDVVEREPAMALFAGIDGLEAYRRIIPMFPALLTPGGMAALEIGYRQKIAVTALFDATDLYVKSRQDIAGRDRAILAYSR